ncbi:PspA/IM30 family protein [Cesiribacter sp. SM1]|uniref:PspA/IM30 family protein n=1 Tax=Cesiribacter sp. SM1 TaxID=2861196 RepID=UPI001CD61232|nr:PspA/IM30 family protein [Cesiribacter sp. SM1]
MNIFRRLFKIGQAETHSAIDQLENPIRLTEQGIRDMKEDLDKSLQALAEVKAMAIRSRSESEEYQQKAQNYEHKAIQLLKKAQAGEMDSAEADRLAGEALLRKEENVKLSEGSRRDVERFDGSVQQLEGNIRTIRANIAKWENELKTLKARVKVSSATKSLNKQLAQIDSSSTVSMLERMRDKVAQEEALAESYGQIANESRSIDDEIEKALNDGPRSARTAGELEALKNRLGINKPAGEGNA